MDGFGLPRQISTMIVNLPSSVDVVLVNAVNIISTDVHRTEECQFVFTFFHHTSRLQLV